MTIKSVIIGIYNILRFGEINPSSKKIKLYYINKLSKKTNSLFIHIPKAAGISFQQGLYDIDSFGHLPIKDVQEYMDEDKFNQMYKFTIVRNPYDRLISAYLYLKKGGRGALIDLEYQKKIEKYKNFEDFVLNFFTTQDFMQMEHFIPQTEWLIDEAGVLKVDYIGYFETIEDEFEIIYRQIFSMSPQNHLPRKNPTNVANEIQFSREMLNIINSIYLKDFELLNYNIRLF